MKRILTSLLLAFACIVVNAFPEKPAVEGPVNDFAGLLSNDEITSLQHLLIDFADSTSNQIIVVIVPDLEGMTAADYAIRIGREWKVGSDEFNNGIVFLVKPKIGRNYGEAFIAVGYGLEGAVTDAHCRRLVDDVAIPHFKDDDYYEGIVAVCLGLMKLTNEEYHSPYEEDDTIATILGIFVVIAAIIFVICLVVSDENNSGGGKGSGRRGPRVIVIPTGGSHSSMGGFGGSSGGFSGGFHGGFGGGGFSGGGGGGRW